MEPEERTRGTRKGSLAKAFGPTERVFESSALSPAKVKVENRRETVAQSSVNLVHQLSFRCRHFWFRVFLIRPLVGFEFDRSLTLCFGDETFRGLPLVAFTKQYGPRKVRWAQQDGSQVGPRYLLSRI